MRAAAQAGGSARQAAAREEAASAPALRAKSMRCAHRARMSAQSLRAPQQAGSVCAVAAGGSRLRITRASPSTPAARAAMLARLSQRALRGASRRVADAAAPSCAASARLHDDAKAPPGREASADAPRDSGEASTSTHFGACTRCAVSKFRPLRMSCAEACARLRLRLSGGACGGKAGPGGGRLRRRGAQVRRDERPDVRGTAPPLEGPPGALQQR
jgi:hypothetical protein